MGQELWLFQSYVCHLTTLRWDRKGQPALECTTAASCHYDSGTMKLSPKQAPLYGECVLTVQLDEDDDDTHAARAEEAEFYLLFAGSNRRHISSTVRVGRVTLQAVCPAHDVCEQVLVTLCLARPDGPVDTHSQENFRYVQDLALDMAHFLLDSNAPQDVLLLADNQIPSKECQRLDQNLALALKYLTRPLRGMSKSDAVKNTHGLSGSAEVPNCSVRSSLLHQAAVHGLKTVASFLLQQPGGPDALRWTDARGHTPASLAKSRGHTQLLELFSRYEASSGDCVEPAEEANSAADPRVFQHHSALDTFTLTWDERLGAADDGGCLQEDVRELRRRIQSHRSRKGNPDDGGLVAPACTNGQQDSRGLAGVVVAEEPTHPGSLEDCPLVDGSAVHTVVSAGTAGQETEERSSSAKPHVGRSRKNKRKTNKNAKHATDSPGSSSKNTPESVKGTSARPPKTTGSGLQGGLPAVQRTEAMMPAVLTDPCCVATKETLLAPKPKVSAPASDGNRKAVAIVTTAVVEKQEGEKWEVEQLIPESVTETEQRPEQAAALDAGRPVNMGQEQSQNPRDSQTVAEEPRLADSTHPSPPPGRANSPEPQRNPCAGRGTDSPRTKWYHNEDPGADSRPADQNSLTVWYDDGTVEEKESRQLEEEEKQCGLISTQASGLSASQLSEHGQRSPPLSPGLSGPHAAGALPAPSHGLCAQRREMRGSQPEEEVGAGWKEGVEQEALSFETTLESEDKGAKSRKKKRKKKGRRGGAEAELDSGLSLELENEGKVLAAATETEAEDKTGWEKVQSPSEEADSAVMRLPSQTDTRDTLVPDSASQQDHGRSQITASPLRDESLDLGTESGWLDAPSSVEESKDLECGTEPDAQYTAQSSSQCLDNTDVSLFEVADLDSLTQSEYDETDRTTDGNPSVANEGRQRTDDESLLDVWSAQAEVGTSPEDPKAQGTDELTSQTSEADLSLDRKVEVRQVDSSEGENSPIMDLTAAASEDGTTGSNRPSEQTVPSIFTEDSLVEEFPERNMPHSGIGSDPPQPSEASEKPPVETAVAAEGTTDVQLKDGSAEKTAGDRFSHCSAAETLTEGKHNGLGAANEETGTWRRQESRGGDDERGSDACYGGVRSDENLVATAVAVVTVAIASAVAHLEICQHFSSTKRSSPHDTLTQLVENSVPQVSTQLTDNSCQLLAYSQTALLLSKPAADPGQGGESVSKDSEGRSHSPDQTVQVCQSEDVVRLNDGVSEVQGEGPTESDDEECHVDLQTEQPERHLNSPVVDTGQDVSDGSVQLLRDEAAEMLSAGVALSAEPNELITQLGSADFEFSMERESEQPAGVQTPSLDTIPSSPHACGFTSPAPDAESTPPRLEIQTSDLVAAPEQVASDDVLQVKDHATSATESCGEDTVDGWKEREHQRKQAGERTDTAVGTSLPDPPLSLKDLLLGRGQPGNTDSLMIQRERDVFYPVPTCPEPTSLPCPDVKPTRDVCGQCPEVIMEGLKESSDPDDNVFKKPKDPDPCCPGDETRGVRVSWPSTDESSVQSSTERDSWKSEQEEAGEVEAEVGEEEEKKDKLSDDPVSSAILRASIRSLSPFRRHSWEPSKNTSATDMDLMPRSSLRGLSGDAKRVKAPLHRRSMSWCPSNMSHPGQEQIDNRSYSLEGLEVERRAEATSCIADQEDRGGGPRLDRHEGGSLLSLTEEDQDRCGVACQSSHPVVSMTTSCPASFHAQPLTKSVSMVAISHRDADGGSSFSSGSLEYSISEEDPGPLRSDAEVKGGPRISRTFSYLRNKMTKKGKEKERRRDGERESKEEKKKTNGHQFLPVSPAPQASCQHCNKPLHHKETFACNSCGVLVHKGCRENLTVCCVSKTKTVTDAAAGSAANMRSKSTSSASSISSTSSSSSRDRWSTIASPEDQILPVFPRKPPGIFNTHTNLSKSISTSNIAGLDEVPLKGLKFLSQSTDSLHQGSKVNASTESLTDEGTEMMDNQLMGEFDLDSKDLEADSWSATVDKKFLKTLKKDEIKRQDVIYEFYQTEFHHVRTLKIMMEVYYKGIQKELQLDSVTLEKIFPVLDDLLDTHTRFLTLLLEQKRAACSDAHNGNNYLICCIGDVLVGQFSGCSADRMKKVYGKFCSRHNEAVNVYKELHAKDKRFQAFIKKIMSSSIVRRLSIPECILLVTQRITKYPVLIQRILQHTKDSDEDFSWVSEALRCVKELITAVDSKVNEHEKKRRLRDVHSRTDSKSIMRMKSGQMFAKQDLIRGRKLLHDGALQLKNSAGRLKDVHAMLLSDVLVFLQEKDQKFVFAALDQRSTVISLQNLIVREVANEERGLFLITTAPEKPEMVEVLASSKEERNTWRAIIQDAMHCMEKDEDEGVPSETEEDRRQQENRAKEIRELLRVKDEQIISLLEEKVHIFKDLSDGGPAAEDQPLRDRMLFRATAEDVTKGEPIIKDALSEVETLHTLINAGLGGHGCSVPVGLTGGGVGPVCLPRRAETFGGFDSHQMNSNKNGEKEEGEEALDLRRTESDSVLKKGATASLQMLLKRNNEVQMSVRRLHSLLISLQAVVVQQDSFVEEQRQALNERLAATSSRHSSSSSLSSSSSRPSSLIEQEKHRSLERQRQEAASLQKQQAAHQEEKRRREKEWEQREKSLAEREERLHEEEEETRKRSEELTWEKESLQVKKEEYQRELERLREAQRRLEKDREVLRRHEQGEQHQRYQRTPSTTSEESLRFQSSGSLELDSREAAELSKEVELSSSAPSKEPFLRLGSKRMGKNFNPFSNSSKTSEKEAQQPSRLLKLTKPKDKKEKKKKKGEEPGPREGAVPSSSEPQNDSDIFFC
ncbi:A-kinase anchor protein 13 isoform X3 [Synchiropus splendidus]|uniref:A-kinase anchor protein 13 isoform X3 n=1 Tax=Synchiropus splendidus TaxID=270530 RepID=UPI00237E5C42|nr:A-kinase anchor protein 13 isoform X3 [Synchiropus splendidus]